MIKNSSETLALKYAAFALAYVKNRPASSTQLEGIIHEHIGILKLDHIGNTLSRLLGKYVISAETRTSGKNTPRAYSFQPMLYEILERRIKKATLLDDVSRGVARLAEWQAEKSVNRHEMSRVFKDALEEFERKVV